MKKKKLLKFLLLPLVVSTITANATSGSINYLVNYTGSITVGTDTLGGVTYSTVSFGDLTNSGEPGKPLLPIGYIKFSVPYNATNFTVSASSRMFFNMNIDHMLYPSQFQLPTIGNTVPSIVLPDTSAYYSGNYFPSQKVWVVDEGFLAGENHIVTVAVMPISYLHTPTQDKLIQAIGLNVILSYELNNAQSMTPIANISSSERHVGFNMTKALVVNPTDVETFASSEDFPIAQYGMSSGVNYLDSISNDLYLSSLGDPEEIISNMAPNYDYIIITTSALKPSLKRIAALKRQKGYRTGIVTMEEILRNPFIPGGDVVYTNSEWKTAYDDNAGILRQYLKLAYGSHPNRFALLAGASLPLRYIELSTPFGFETITLPSDLYFSDFNGDWSAHKIDKNPEVFTGRIIAKTQEQISNYTDKLFRYVLNPGKGNTAYLKRALYSEGYDMRKNNETNRVKRELDSVFTQSVVMQEAADYYAQGKFPSGEDIVNEINNTQYGFLSFHNHGYPSGILTYGFRNNDYMQGSLLDYPYFLWAIDSVHVTNLSNSIIEHDTSTNNGLNNILNKDYPNVCYSTACSLMPFDTIPGFGNIPMNFGESFTTGKNYGGPAFFGNTRDGGSPASSELEEKFGYILRNGTYKAGMAEANSKIMYNPFRHEYICAVHNLLGDPEFDIWTDEPQQYQGITVTRTDNSITVSGINSIDPAIVAYSYLQTDWHQGTDTISESSVTFNDISPNSTIMVYQHNYIPFIAPLELQNVDLNKSQYIIASDAVAGNAVNAKRTIGDVVVKRGAQYEIEASGVVRLEDGFTVEKGATFAVYPSSF